MARNGRREAIRMTNERRLSKDGDKMRAMSQIDRPKMSPLRILDLFSGIGGFSLGLEAVGGFKTVAFCESERSCHRVLSRHWPGVPIYDDVCLLTSTRLSADGISVDVLCGGFPCQDISSAGQKKGIEGERSGLWREYYRLIGELRPSYVIVENVAAILGRGLPRVLGDLASVGYDAEWHCVPASAIGANHRRDRIWIIAYPQNWGREQKQSPSHCELEKAPERRQRPWPGTGAGSSSGHTSERTAVTGRITAALAKALAGAQRPEAGIFEPGVAGIIHGVPKGVDGYRWRSNKIGNAVVPAIPSLIGRAILDAGA